MLTADSLVNRMTTWISKSVLSDEETELLEALMAQVRVWEKRAEAKG